MGKIRILGGELRGRSITSVEGPGYRPATAKVREALFNMLGARGFTFHDARVADFFAGSGSLGTEALSRGAKYVLFVEKSRKAAAAIRANLTALGVARERARVEPRDLAQVLARRPAAPFELIFIDPPYGQALLLPSLKAALDGGWIAPDGLVLAESDVRRDAADPTPEWELEPLVDRTYGQTRIQLWRAPGRARPSIPALSTR